MAEVQTNLTQRVEALEQISHTRVVERVGKIEQRVSRIESAREAEEPHVASKADIARLETRIAELRTDLLEQNAETRAELLAQNAETRADLQLQIAELQTELLEQNAETRIELQSQNAETRIELLAQNAETRADLQLQIADTKSGLEDRIGQVEVAVEKRLRIFLMWLVGTGLSLAGVIIAATAFIVSQLP